MTHIAWDDFTHAGGFFVDHLAFLREQLPFWPHFSAYRTLQHFSTFAGLALIALAYRNWLKRTPIQEKCVVAPLQHRAKKVLMAVAFLFSALLAAVLAEEFAEHFPREEFRVFIVRFVVTLITVIFTQLIGFSIYWHFAKKKAPEPEFQGSR
jgi:glycerol uptake facilitator-like aquaporin